MSSATLQAEHCPVCRSEMHYESTKTLTFNGGRGDTKVNRFHCSRCRKFMNIPVEAPAEKK